RRGRGLSADVHSRNSRRPKELLVRVDPIGQAQLFPDNLEQPARHPAPEHVGDDREREPSPVSIREGVGAEHKVRRGRVPRDAEVATPDGGDRSYGGKWRLGGATGEPALAFQQFEDTIMLKTARGRNYAVAAIVPCPVQSLEITGAQSADRVTGAKD